MPLEIDFSDPTIAEYDRLFSSQYEDFAKHLTEEYTKVRNAYAGEQAAIFEAQKKHNSEEYSERNQQIETLGEACKAKLNRVDQMLEIVERFVVIKYRRILTRKLLDVWKAWHKSEHRLSGLEVYTDNYGKRRLMQKCFLGWRKSTHVTRKRLIEQEYAFKLEKLKTGKLTEYDNRVREMLARIEAAKRILAEEIAIKEKLTMEYEQALGRGVGALSKETQAISSNPIIAGIV